MADGKLAAGKTLHQSRQLDVFTNLHGTDQGVFVPEPLTPLFQPVGVTIGRPPGCRCDQFGSNQEIDCRGLVGRDSFAKIALPSGKPIDPGTHCVTVDADPVDIEAGLPAVVDKRLHRHLLPDRFVTRSKLQHDGQGFVAVVEDVGFDDDPLANRPFDRIPSRIDLGAHTLNDDAALSI